MATNICGLACFAGDPQPSRRNRTPSGVGSARGLNGNIDLLISRQQLPTCRSIHSAVAAGRNRAPISNDLRSGQLERFFGSLVGENLAKVARPWR
jgi:hypothetical protein